MFTGLIAFEGRIAATGGKGPVRLTVEAPELAREGLTLGESIATSGVCLTVVEATADGFVAEAGAETLVRTTAGQWRPGRRVNLERALRLEDRLGGHLVLGHVDGVGRVRSRSDHDGVLELEISLPDAIAPLVCEKGSIAVDGVSLTVNAVPDGAFRVTLVPETRRRTTLEQLATGDSVNLEADILARHIARLVGFLGQGGAAAGAGEKHLDLAFLARHGYL